MKQYLLALDQGTTSTRAIVYTFDGAIIAQHQIPFQQYFPNNGWVEHDPEEIWNTTVLCIKEAMAKAQIQATDVVALGISNQRETTLVWDRQTHQAIYPAIVWQDRRTEALCHTLIDSGLQDQIIEKTGLVLDPYFSATKLAWILKHVDGAESLAKAGRLAFGTINCFLLWRFTGGKSHATDITNASRTLLFNIKEQNWDDDLLALFNIPKSLLPTVLDNCADFGKTEAHLFGAEIPIAAMAGDQQAALMGQACLRPGMLKSTYGTGCFMMMNTGEHMIRSQHYLLTTIAYRIQGTLHYALEGSVFIAGAALQWLRDAMHFIQKAQDAEAMAQSLSDNHGVYLVPAFTGLGAPYWDPLARGAILGLTRDTSIAHIVRAAQEAVCYQTRDLLEAAYQDGFIRPEQLRVDGGMTVNNWLMQFLADILNIRIERAVSAEISALGVAFLAGLQAGVFTQLDDMKQLWRKDRIFEPHMLDIERERLYSEWGQAVKRVVR